MSIACRTTIKMMRIEMFLDDPTCKLCDNIIHQYKDASLDHIKPISKGGTHNRYNLQLAHRWCNKYKADHYEPTIKELLVDLMLKLFEPMNKWSRILCKNDDYRKLKKTKISLKNKIKEIELDLLLPKK